MTQRSGEHSVESFSACPPFPNPSPSRGDGFSGSVFTGYRLFLLLLGFAVFQPALAAGDNPQAALARDVQCTVCHDEMEGKPILSIYQTRHGVKADGRTPVCQDCHGDSLAHAGTRKGTQKFPLTDLPVGKQRPVAAQNDACLACHQSGATNTAKHWLGSAHERQGIACATCHTVHAPRDPGLARSKQAKACLACHQTQRAELHLPSAHPVSKGQMLCGDCHNPHGSDGPKLLLQETINDTCFTCHAEKRGPFLWEHAPVSDNCTLCHTPHGSTARPLLKLRNPWLCQQCHSSSGHPSTAYGNAANINSVAQLPLRGCANCHSQVHGSNHPGGSRLLR